MGNNLLFLAGGATNSGEASEQVIAYNFDDGTITDEWFMPTALIAPAVIYQQNQLIVAGILESVNIDDLLKKQEQAKFSHAIENEKDIDKIDFEKIEQLIANQIAGTKEEKASSDDCEDQPGI